MKIKKQVLLALLVTLLMLINLSLPVLAQNTIVDKTGPDYHGKIAMAGGINPIGSDEEFDKALATGLPGASDCQDEAKSAVLTNEPVCGTTLLPQNNSLKAQQKADPTAESKSYQVGDTKSLSSYYKEVKEYTAEMIYAGKTCTIWRDKALPQEIFTKDQAKEIADTMDNQIYGPMLEAFGDWSKWDVDKDGKTAFVFYEMNNDMLGYFYNQDLFSKEDGGNGNCMDMLNFGTADLKKNKERLMGTLAHELQHLINYAQTEQGSYKEGWLDEVFAQSAIAITGQANDTSVGEVKTQEDFYDDNGYTAPFIFKDNYVAETQDSVDPYGMWYIFGRYLSHQTAGYYNGGDNIYKKILVSVDENNKRLGCTLKGIEAALKEVGYMGEGCAVSNMEELIVNFNTALYLKEPTGLYSLGANPQNPKDIDGVTAPDFDSLDTARATIPGGGSATFSNISGSVTPQKPAPEIRFSGINTEALSGVNIGPVKDIYTLGETLTLSTTDKNAEIWYAFGENADPVKEGTLYKAPIILTENTIIKACTVDQDNQISEIKTHSISVRSNEVTADKASGSLKAGDKVTLSCSTANAEIWYTTDGTDPNPKEGKGQRYTEPITITADTTLRAGSYCPGKNIGVGPVRSFDYKIRPPQPDGYEPNDSQSQATVFSFPANVKATIHTPEDVDYYTFELTTPATLSLTLTPPEKASYGITLFDEKGTQLSESSLKNNSQNLRYPSASGKYSVKVQSLDKSVDEGKTYTLNLRKEYDTQLTKNLDLSERNMLMALNDKESGYAWDLGINGGGNNLMSQAYFSHWDGPVDESQDRYDDNPEQAVEYKALSPKYHVQNTLYLPGNDGERENSIAALKNAVYSYGAADIYVLIAGAYFTQDGKNLFVDQEDFTYQCKRGNNGHIVTVVGWDDNYNKENFTGSPEVARKFGYEDPKIPQPKNNGAFIIKNSWGDEEGQGDKGYFYLSYEDAYMFSNNPTVFMADEMPDNYNKQYMNDPWGTVELLSNSNINASQTFTTEGEPELLKAVSFVLGSANTRYEISVTTEGQTKKVAEGVKKYAGYYTEPLNQAITLPAGKDFTISLRLESTDSSRNSSIGYSKNLSGVTSGIPKKTGICYYNGEDIGAKGSYVNLRAYTCNTSNQNYTDAIQTAGIQTAQMTEAQSADIQKNDDTLIDSGITYFGQETAGTYGAIGVHMQNADTAQAPVTNLPAKFDLRETGTLTPVRNQGNLGSCWTFAAIASIENNIVRNGGYAVDYPQSVSLSQREETLLLTSQSPEQDLNLTASLVGAQSPASTRINWSVSGDVDSVRLKTTASQSGESVSVITALKPGNVTITATSDADITATASCSLTITNQGVETITLTPDKLTLNKGETANLTAVTGPETAMDKTVVYQSDQPQIANVDENGKVTAISGGEATITAKAGTAQATATVTVKGSKAVNPGGTNAKTGMNNTAQNPVIAMILLLTAGAGLLAYKKRTP
ncbi:MAG: FN3 associated domain-containing protein [Eubacterium sp.]